MKYCTKCGAQLLDDAVICLKCGCASSPMYGMATGKVGECEPSGIKKAALIFMIINAVISGLLGFFALTLAWKLPMLFSYNAKIKKGQPVSTGFKVCTLLFVGMTAGILMLCDDQ